MLKNKTFFLIAALTLIAGAINAQTTSPYSRYGYGILKDQAVGPSKSMGGIGYGLRQKYGANPLNPASYSTVDSLTFMFDLGVNYTKGTLTEGNASKSDDNGGLEYATMLFPVTKKLGISFGLLPYSSVGYNIDNIKSAGDEQYQESFEGTGGFSQIYLGAGYELPIKGLSVGANIAYMFGSVKHQRSVPAMSSASGLQSYEYTKLKREAIKLDLGFQYQQKISKNDILTIGATFSPKLESKAKYERSEYHSVGVGTPIAGDTINSIKTDIPMTLGVGFSVTHKNRLTLGADVTFQQWEKVRYPEQNLMGDGFTNSNDRFNNRIKYAIGGEYIADPYDRSFFKRIRFRGGLNYSNSYLNTNVFDADGNSLGKAKGYNEYGATIGLGLPIRDLNYSGLRTTYINVNFEYKRIQPEVKGMIKEQYFGVSLGVNINELWFRKRIIE